MKRTAGRTLIGATLLSLLCFAAWYGWTCWERSQATESTDNAYVHADITTISPKVAGYVANGLVADNQVVEAGAVLVRIADEDYRAQRERAQAAVSQAEAGLVNLARRRDLQLATIREAEATIDLAQADVELSGRDLERSSQLVSQGWTPRRSHDAATASAERARANLARAKAVTAAARTQITVLDSETRQAAARLDEARANLQLADIALAETVIRAPVSGVVGNRRVRTGEYVRPGGMLLSVVPVDGIWVVANFKETQVARMRIGERAHVTADGFSGTAIEGRIDSLAPASGAAFSLLPPDNATGNFVKIVQRIPVKILLQPGHALLGRLVPGMSVDVVVDIRSDASRPAPSGDASLKTSTLLFRKDK